MIEPQNTTEPTQPQELHYFKLNTNKLVNLIQKDLLLRAPEGRTFLANHTKKDIINYLQSPATSEKMLRQISNLLYNLSPQYKRLLHYISGMARFDHVIDFNSLSLLNPPIEADKVLKKYLKHANFVNNMNIKHEFNKIFKIILLEDTFFGYDYSTSNSYFIQKLNPDYCRLHGWADGTRVFQFDFTFFNNAYNRNLLESYYAPEFKERYEKYKEFGKDYRWQELNTDRAICIKMNEETEHSAPFFANVFPDIFDLQDYKLLHKVNVEMQNSVLIVGKIPYLKSSEVSNSFALQLDDAVAFGQKIIQEIPDFSSFLLSPYESVDAIHLGDKNSMLKNPVTEAEASFWSSSGVNQAIFNSDKISEESIRKSIQADENMVFSVYRQFERWLNRKIKLSVDSEFRIRILDTTQFNYGEAFKRYKEAAIYGVPVKRELYASLGGNPIDMQSAVIMENEIFKLHDVLNPLISSNTQSNKDDKNGRPAQDSEGAGSTGKKIVKEE